VAYVKVSGVSQLASAIQQFKQRGGEVRAVVGVSRVQKNTSVEGLQNLLPLCDEIWVYNNESPNRTFHPKVYIFEKVGQWGLVFVGSSNLTAGGLYTNYEANIYSEYDLGNTSQADKFASVKQMFEAYSTPSKFCKILTADYLQMLDNNGYLASEAARINQRSEDEEDESGVAETAGERLFGSAGLHAPPVIRPTSPFPERGVGSTRGQVSPAPLAAPVLVAEIPNAGNRWNQANIDLQTFKSLFQLQAGKYDSGVLVPVAENGTVGKPEVRQSVSVMSQNYRIELGLAADRPYPLQGRPIGVFLRVGVRRFRYRLIMPGDAEHSIVKSLLDADWRGPSRMVRRIQLSLAEFRNRAKGVKL